MRMIYKQVHLYNTITIQCLKLNVISHINAEANKNTLYAPKIKINILNYIN